MMYLKKFLIESFNFIFPIVFMALIVYGVMHGIFSDASNKMKSFSDEEILCMKNETKIIHRCIESRLFRCDAYSDFSCGYILEEGLRRRIAVNNSQWIKAIDAVFP